MATVEYTGDAQLAGLIQAATAAADQEMRWSNGDMQQGNGHAREQYDQYAVGAEMPHEYQSSDVAQYPEVDGHPEISLHQPATRNSSLRKRKRYAESDYMPQHQYQMEHLQSLDQGQPYDVSFRPAIDAPSAAALFRPLSTASKKYTRPPMSKMYSSLELTPENFLHLQSAAKSFMLDDNYPDRRNCVGQRARGDSDMIKLKLWNYVKEFLSDLGNGGRFFGENVEGQGSRTIFWPQDAQQIIKLCVPLFRRMVTNERQRQYAVETRKGGSEAKARRQDESQPTDPSGAHSQLANIQSMNHPAQLLESPHQRQGLRSGEGGYGALGATESNVLEPGPAQRSDQGLELEINMVSASPSDSHDVSHNSTKRVSAPFHLSAASVPNLATLRTEIRECIGSGGVDHPVDPVNPVSGHHALGDGLTSSEVKVWLPDGLVRVRDDGEWMVALLSAEMVEWMDKRVKVLVEISPRV